MTKKNLITLSLVLFYGAVVLVIGCIPETTLQWSADGSKGIYSKKGALFLVDGPTGSLTQIASRETTTDWPAVSPDGALFAYGQIVKVDDFNRALNLLPALQIKTIKADAEILKNKILAEGVKNETLPSLGESFNEQHTNWVNRLLIETADKELSGKIKSSTVSKIRNQELIYYQLVLAPTADPNDKKILATSNQQLWRVRFSPDSKVIAYVINPARAKTFEAGFDLYVASCDKKTPPAFAASAVAIGFDFRQDSCAIAYLKPEDENFKEQKLLLGSLVEKTIVDPNGKFLAAPDENTKSYICTGPTKEFAGVLYYSWMSVLYARDNRIFFSSAKITLPSSKLDSEEGSVFCCDTLTGAVSDILPRLALDFSQGNTHLFALSQDSRKMLLPGKNNILGIYRLGPDIESSKVLVDVNENFGDDAPPKLYSQWKGPDQISCLVSEKSRYLTADPNAPARRKEIIILDDKGNLVQVLSKSWPDELLEF
jgi:hypothetical protein